MSYATVLIDGPTEPLTYRLTPETLSGAIPGALVEVPVGPKTALAVVLRLERSVSSKIKDKLRPLGRVLSRGVWAPPATQRLAEAMALYSDQRAGVCVFRLLPPSSRRTNHAVRPAARRLPSQTLHVYGPRSSRIEQYRTLTQRAIAGKRQVILVAPQSQHEWLVEQFVTGRQHPRGDRAIHLGGVDDQAIHSPSGAGSSANQRPFHIQTVSGELAPGKQRQIAEDLATGLLDVLITTRHAIGWPAYALGAVIVDDPHHQAHVDDQRPYLDSATIALLRSSVEGGYAVLGTSLPTPTLLLREARGLAVRLAARPDSSEVSDSISSGVFRATQLTDEIPLNPPLPKGGSAGAPPVRTTGVGSLAPIRVLTASSRQLILPQVIHRLGEVLTAGQRAAVIAPHHGDSGVGVDSIRSWLAEHAPELLAQGLMVDTEGILESHQSYGVISFIAADGPLSSPDLLRPVRYLDAIVEAQALAAEVLVQAHTSQSPWLRSLTDPSVLAEILSERQAASLPPYVRTLHLLGPSDSETDVLGKLSAYDLGRVEHFSDQLQIDLHCPVADQPTILSNVKRLLGRAWRVMADSILEHATDVRGMIRSL